LPHLPDEYHTRWHSCECAKLKLCIPYYKKLGITVTSANKFG
jgi:hypothetical protein